MINRDDMLELTRRMTLKRTHFTRMAGCYVDADGDFDGSFNKTFANLSVKDREEQLAIAKAIPFAATNKALKEVTFPGKSVKNKELQKLLLGIRSCNLKNDALLDVFYDLVMEEYQPDMPYSILMYHGVYDIPRKGSDHEWQGESEEIFDYLICAICPVTGDYHSEKPVRGFLYPAYADRGADMDHIDVFGEWIFDHK